MESRLMPASTTALSLVKRDRKGYLKTYSEIPSISPRKKE